jgi:hypothetical protein
LIRFLVDAGCDARADFQRSVCIGVGQQSDEPGVTVARENVAIALNGLPTLFNRVQNPIDAVSAIGVQKKSGSFNSIDTTVSNSPASWAFSI